MVAGRVSSAMAAELGTTTRWVYASRDRGFDADAVEETASVAAGTGDA